MSPSTYNMYANEAYIDHGYNFTLADAVDYAEFIEDVNTGKNRRTDEKFL